MITDFGLSKSLDNNETSLVGGMVGYIEPQCFINSNYRRDKASDIYSLGVLLWEISSGRPPFNNMAILDIARNVIQGKREAPIEGSPPAYVTIYQLAWDSEPRRRPTIDKLREDLEILQPSNDLVSRMDELVITQVSSPVSEHGNFSNFGLQNQQAVPYGVADSMNPNNKKSTLVDSYIRPNNNIGQLMSPPNSNEISTESHKRNSQSLPYGIATSMSPHKPNTVNAIYNNHTAPIPIVNHGQTQNPQVSQSSSSNQYSNVPTIRPRNNTPQPNNRPPSNQQPTVNPIRPQKYNTMPQMPPNTLSYIPQVSQPQPHQQQPYQQQLSQPQSYQQQPSPQPYQQQQRPYQPQPQQPQQRPYQPPQPQPYQQQQPQPQQRPYQPHQPQQRPYQPPQSQPQPQPQQRPHQPPQPQQRPPQPQPHQRPPQPHQPHQRPPQPHQPHQRPPQPHQPHQRPPQPHQPHQPQHPQHQPQHSNQYQFPPQQNFQPQPQKANTFDSMLIPPF
jgi:hypothetical protein